MIENIKLTVFSKAFSDKTIEVFFYLLLKNQPEKKDEALKLIKVHRSRLYRKLKSKY